MRKVNIILVVIVGWLFTAVRAGAQDTNAPLTNLEVFEAQTGTVIVKGSAMIGTIPAGTGTVSVRAKESTDPGSGRKEYGIAVELKEGSRPEDTTMVDYDELGSFLNGIDYISKVNHGVTSLPSFDVIYTTGGGLRLGVYTSNRRPGTIQAALQSGHLNRTRILLSADQLTRFQGLIQQAKGKLDSLREIKQP